MYLPYVFGRFAGKEVVDNESTNGTVPKFQLDESDPTIVAMRIAAASYRLKIGFKLPGDDKKGTQYNRAIITIDKGPDNINGQYGIISHTANIGDT